MAPICIYQIRVSIFVSLFLTFRFFSPFIRHTCYVIFRRHKLFATRTYFCINSWLIFVCNVSPLCSNNNTAISFRHIFSHKSISKANAVRNILSDKREKTITTIMGGWASSPATNSLHIYMLAPQWYIKYRKQCVSTTGKKSSFDLAKIVWKWNCCVNSDSTTHSHHR